MRAGDVIVAMDGQPVVRMVDVAGRLQSIAVGTPVKIELIRQGVRTEATATTADRPTTASLAAN